MDTNTMDTTTIQLGAHVQACREQFRRHQCLRFALFLLCLVWLCLLLTGLTLEYYHFFDSFQNPSLEVLRASMVWLLLATQMIGLLAITLKSFCLGLLYFVLFLIQYASHLAMTVLLYFGHFELNYHFFKFSIASIMILFVALNLMYALNLVVAVAYLVTFYGKLRAKQAWSKEGLEEIKEPSNVVDKNDDFHKLIKDEFDSVSIELCVLGTNGTANNGGGDVVVDDGEQFDNIKNQMLEEDQEEEVEVESTRRQGFDSISSSPSPVKGGIRVLPPGTPPTPRDRCFSLSKLEELEVKSVREPFRNFNSFVSNH